MRRIAAVLVLPLTASVAQAGVEEGGGSWGNAVIPLACCASMPFVLMLSLIVTMVIYDWRKARRPPPPPEDE